MNILIVYSTSGRGLQKDALILDTALRQLGHECNRIPIPPTPAWRTRVSSYRYKILQRYSPVALKRLYYKTQLTLHNLFKPKKKADLVIHLENISINHLKAGHRHWLIPNQEWFIESRLPYLRFVDRVCCKTRHAESIFSALHPATHYLGFTGGDPLTSAAIEKDYNLAVHIAGNSQFKGTNTVISCWQKHPEWPKLLVVSRHLKMGACCSENIEIRNTITDSELAKLWATAGFAVLPSEVEGYGQALAESLANGCVTITTDAPPMNELIDKKSGWLAPVEQKLTFRLGTRFLVLEHGLERAIEAAVTQKPNDLEQRSTLSKSWYADNHDQFISRLQAELRPLAEQPHDQSAQSLAEKPSQ